MSMKDWETKEAEINAIIDEIDNLIDEIDALLNDELILETPPVAVEA